MYSNIFCIVFIVPSLLGTRNYVKEITKNKAFKPYFNLALAGRYVQNFKLNKNDAGIGITSFLCKIKPRHIPFGISLGRFSVDEVFIYYGKGEHSSLFTNHPLP
jgi:hypothetical protein